MSSDTIRTMLLHERSILNNTIERLERGIQIDVKVGMPVDGQRTILQTQQLHLTSIESLMQIADDFSSALIECRAHLIVAEENHRKDAQRDLMDRTFTHSDAWWRSLHDIEYYSDLIHRIESWQKQHGG